jgi:probable HAF family extracellular repeat protein
MPIAYAYSPLNDPSAVNGTTHPTAINNKGQVLGSYTASDGLQQTFLYSGGQDGTFTDVTINVPAGQNLLSANGINDWDVIVGDAFSVSNGNDVGFIYNHGSYVEISDPLAFNTFAYGVNDRDQVVGGYETSAGQYYGYVYDHGAYKPIDDPLAGDVVGTGTTAVGINNKGQIVGNYTDANFQSHGFLFSGGHYTTIDDPLGSQTVLFGINDRGQIVGEYLEGSVWHNFLYSHGTFTTIDDPSVSVVFNEGINDRGQIAGNGFYLNGQTVDYPGFIGNPTLTDSAANLESLTPKDIKALPVADIVSTGPGNTEFSAAQVKAFEQTGIKVSGPSGTQIDLTDSAANVFSLLTGDSFVFKEHLTPNPQNSDNMHATVDIQGGWTLLNGDSHPFDLPTDDTFIFKNLATNLQKLEDVGITNINIQTGFHTFDIPQTVPVLLQEVEALLGAHTNETVEHISDAFSHLQHQWHI